MNSSYYKNSERNYIIVKEYHGNSHYEGEYLNFHPDGIYIEYDKMGRKITEGAIQFPSRKVH
jgi:hypothetical protein